MSDERVDRRLVAVLAADIAGYSRLMGCDEERTLAQLRELCPTATPELFARFLRYQQRVPRADPLFVAMLTNTRQHFGRWEPPAEYLSALESTRRFHMAATRRNA